MGGIKSYRDLKAWQEAMRLADQVYDVTEKYPKAQLYILVSQTQRAAVSIPSNIAEGHSRGSRKDYRQFLIVARASLSEMETQLYLARKRNFITGEELRIILIRSTSVLKMLNALIRS